MPGDSVLFLAAKTNYPNYFKYVMQHGGNPNFVSGHEGFRTSPLKALMKGRCPNKSEAVQLLIDAGADLEYRESSLNTTALSYSLPDYPITLQLLKAGASFNECKDDGATFLHHFLSLHLDLLVYPEIKEEYQSVLEWLEANGADIEGAKKDIRLVA